MEAEIIETIAPAKEVDAFTLINKGKSTSNLAKFTPSAPGGIIGPPIANNNPITGNLAVIVGKSPLVGKPIAEMLTNIYTTVVVFYSKTQKLKEISNMADVLVVVIGKPKFITAEPLRKGRVL